MSEGQEFLKECKEVRNDFVKIAGQYSVGEHLKLRTKIDTLLIMYDQLCERVRLADSSDESSGLHKHGVNASFFKELIYYEIKAKKEARDKEISDLAKAVIAGIIFLVVLLIIGHVYY